MQDSKLVAVFQKLLVFMYRTAIGRLLKNMWLVTLSFHHLNGWCSTKKEYLAQFHYLWWIVEPILGEYEHVRDNNENYTQQTVGEI